MSLCCDIFVVCMHGINDDNSVCLSHIMHCVKKAEHTIQIFLQLITLNAGAVYYYYYKRFMALSGNTQMSRYQKDKTEMMGWQWHQLDHMQVICTFLQTTLPTPHPSSFYGPDALPAANQQHQSTEGTRCSMI